MGELSSTPTERARNAHAAVLQSLAPAGTARNAALAMGTSETTVSRIKGTLEDALVLVYQLGFKLVPADRICVDRDKYLAMVTIARAAMACEQTTNRLIWDEE